MYINAYHSNKIINLIITFFQNKCLIVVGEAGLSLYRQISNNQLHYFLEDQLNKLESNEMIIRISYDTKKEIASMLIRKCYEANNLDLIRHGTDHIIYYNVTMLSVSPVKFDSGPIKSTITPTLYHHLPHCNFVLLLCL